jgi:high affinity Mn2+ porin
MPGPRPGCPDHDAEETTSLHYQATVATQYHPTFQARYSGQNSMRPASEGATSVVVDVFAGVQS